MAELDLTPAELRQGVEGADRVGETDSRSAGAAPPELGSLVSRVRRMAVVGWLALAAATPARSVEVEFLEPAAAVPLVGEMEVVVSVRSQEPPAAVELRLDGQTVWRWVERPYRLHHDFGLSGRSRTLEAVVITVSGALSTARLESPAVRIDEALDLELQQLYVTVEDRRGRRQLDLDRQAFEVLEAGRAQQIVTFAAGDIPFSALVLIDASESMKGHRLNSALTAAGRFLDGMSDLDRSQVLVFSERVLAATAIGSREELAAGPRQRIEAAGGTAIRDHLFLAGSLLESRQGRRALILLSDGWDGLSVLSAANLEDAVERWQSTLYWVRLAGDEPSSRWRGEFALRAGRDFSQLRQRFHPTPTSWADESQARESYRALEELVGLTGGRILTGQTPADLDTAMAEVLAELHEQYALGYYPSPRGAPGEWRPVEVRLRGRGLELRARRGYVER